MAAYSFTDGTINLDIQVPLADVSGNDLYPMLRRIQKRSINQTAIKWNADVASGSVTGEGVTASATTDSTNGNEQPASLPIGVNRFRSTFSVLTTKMAEAAAVGQGELANLLARASRNKMKALLRQLATSLYTGNGLAAHAGIVGINTFATATDNLSTVDYAGIDVSTYTRWAAYVNDDASARALSQNLMLKMSEEIIGGATTGVPNNYTAVYTSPAIVTRYKELFTSVGDINIAAGGGVDVGFSGVFFEGRPVLLDPYCPQGQLVFVNEDELALYSFTEGQFSFGDEMPADGVNFKIVELSRTNPDAVQFAIVVKPQLQVFRPCAVALLTDIDPDPAS